MCSCSPLTEAMFVKLTSTKTVSSSKRISEGTHEATSSCRLSSGGCSSMVYQKMSQTRSTSLSCLAPLRQRSLLIVKWTKPPVHGCRTVASGPDTNQHASGEPRSVFIDLISESQFAGAVIQSSHPCRSSQLQTRIILDEM